MACNVRLLNDSTAQQTCRVQHNGAPRNFGCVPGHADVMWVDAGCRGLFTCGANATLLSCGRTFASYSRPMKMACSCDAEYARRCGPDVKSFAASACPCSELGCYRRPAADWEPLQCTPSSLCGRTTPTTTASLTSGRATILTLLTYTPKPERGDFSRYLLQFRSLENLLHSLLLTATTLPVHTLVTTRYPAFEERLEALKAQMLPVAPLRPPAWARELFVGTFAKLQVLSLVQFDTVVLLDNDCQVLQNIDHLALVEAPAAVFHQPDSLQPQGGINSGVMVLRPSREAAAEVLEVMRTLPADAAVDGGDQAVWHSYFKRHPVYELPTRYNFRPGGGIYDRDRCLGHIVHTSTSRLGPGERLKGRPEIRQMLYTRTSCWPYLSFPDAVRLKVDRNATAWNERFRRAVVAPPASANVDEARRRPLGPPGDHRRRQQHRAAVADAATDEHEPFRGPVLDPGELIGGLFNQIFSLIGCCLAAHATGSALLLPNFTSHVFHGAQEPFGELFDEAHFRRGMRGAGLRVLRTDEHARHGAAARTWKANREGWRNDTASCADSRLKRTCERHRAAGTCASAGAWGCKRTCGRCSVDEAAPNSWPFLVYFMTVREARRRACATAHPIEAAVWRALQPAPPIAREAARFRAEAGLSDGYGCMHARIERDMQMWASTVGSGPPPTLTHLVEGMAAVPALHTAREVFVAVGKNVPLREDERLLTSGRTSWGARFARTGKAAGVKVSYDSQWSSKAANGSYTRAALVDFAVCKDAAWFVGWPGSTFAQGLAALLDARSAPWYAACPLGEACFDPARAGATPTSLDAKACTTRTAAAEVLSRRTDGGSDDKLCVANRSWACGSSGGGAPASDADLVRAVEAMRPALLPVGIQVRKSALAVYGQ